MRLGVLGGTFDPVHIGHLILGETAREEAGLDRVLFVPAGQPWRKSERDISAAAHRVEMLRLATRDNPSFEVSRLDVNRPGPSYTHVTLEMLKAERPYDELFFILGRDALLDLHNWKSPERIMELATLAVAERSGSGDAGDAAFPGGALTGLEARVVAIPMPLIEVSASEIRERARSERSVRYLVPDAVERYIRERGLYGS